MRSRSCVHPLHICFNIDALLFLPDTCMCSFAQYTQFQVYQRVFLIYSGCLISLQFKCPLSVHFISICECVDTTSKLVGVPCMCGDPLPFCIPLNDGQGLRILNYDEHILFNTCHTTYMHTCTINYGSPMNK